LEFGVIVAQSDLVLRRLPVDLDAQIGLPVEFKELLRDTGTDLITVTGEWTASLVMAQSIELPGQRFLDGTCALMWAYGPT
jgi:hypothetical protein